jgi:hypothetical protein
MSGARPGVWHALVGGLVIVTFGWRTTFIVFGLVSLTWLLPWHAVTRGGVAIATPARSVRPLPYRALPRERAMWGASFGLFCFGYTYYFLLSWLPLFLVKAHGFSVPAMAEIGAGIYVVHAVSAALTGWMSDRWIVAGARSLRSKVDGLPISPTTGRRQLEIPDDNSQHGPAGRANDPLRCVEMTDSSSTLVIQLRRRQRSVVVVASGHEHLSVGQHRRYGQAPPRRQVGRGR